MAESAAAATNTDGFLIEAFARHAPRAVARRVELAKPADGARVLGGLSEASGAAVLAAMPPPSAAEVLGAMDAERAAALCEALDAPPLANVLRCLELRAREAILQGLSAPLRRAVAPLLSRPLDRVGAHVDPRVLVFSVDTDVAHALDAIGKHAQRATDQLFVVRGEQVLVGWVEWSALLQAEPSASISTLMDRDPPALPAGLLLSDAAEHPGWAQSRTLPVLDADERLIGGLHYARALGAREGLESSADASKTAQEFGSLLSIGLSALWRSGGDGDGGGPA